MTRTQRTLSTLRRAGTAVALATDVQCRLYASTPRSLGSGWDVAYLFATFGAAVAAGHHPIGPHADAGA